MAFMLMALAVHMLLFPIAFAFSLPSFSSTGINDASQRMATSDFNARSSYERSLEIASEVKSPFDVVVKMSTMPPCNRVATSKLVNSCQRPDDSNANIEVISGRYATNLAVCELHDAGVEVPKACIILVPSPETVNKVAFQGFLNSGLILDPTFSYHSYDKTTRKASDKCTSALFEKSQWWTSFSNNKQNAYQICKTYRAAIDKDELMRAIALMAGKTNDLDFKLLSSLDSAEKIIDLINEMRKMHAQDQANWHNVTANLTMSLHEAQGKLSAQAQKDLATLAHSHNQSLNMFDNGVRNINQLLFHMQDVNTEIFMARESASRINQEMDTMTRKVADVNEEIASLNKTTASLTETIVNRCLELTKHIENVSAVMEPIYGIFNAISLVPALIEWAFRSSIVFLAVFCIVLPVLASKELPAWKARTAAIGFGIATSLVAGNYRWLVMDVCGLSLPAATLIGLSHLGSALLGAACGLYMLLATCSQTFGLPEQVRLLRKLRPGNPSSVVVRVVASTAPQAAAPPGPQVRRTRFDVGPPGR